MIILFVAQLFGIKIKVNNILLPPNRSIPSEMFGAKRASSAIPKLNLSQITKAPKKAIQNTKCGPATKVVRVPLHQERSSSRVSESLRALSLSVGGSKRDLKIPKVVKAIRVIDTKTSMKTGRSSSQLPDYDAASGSTCSKPASAKRVVTLLRRRVPMDILTDAKANSSEMQDSTARSSARHESERRVNRHRYQIGVSQDAKVRELLRIASASTSRDKRRYL